MDEDKEDVSDIDPAKLLDEIASLNHWLADIEAESGSLFTAEEADHDKELIAETEALLNDHFGKYQISNGVTEEEAAKMMHEESVLSKTMAKLSKKRYAASFFWNLVQKHVRNFYNPDVSMADARHHLKSENPFANDQDVPDKPKLPFNNRTLAYREDPLADQILYPKSYDELIGVMEQAIERHMTIKPMGTQYAFNDITFTAGIQCDVYKFLFEPILEDKLNEEVKNELLSEYGMKHVNNKHMIISEAGTTTKMVHSKTWPIPKGPNSFRKCTHDENGDPYHMLPYMPGFHMLTLGGTIQVGAEGQGRLKAAVQNMVLSIHMLTFERDPETGKPYVQPVQIEPSVKTGAIHDKTKWDEYYSTFEPKKRVKLIQDDEIFNSAVCCVGTFGIVYSYHLKLVNAVNVVQHRFMINWNDYKRYYPLIRKWEHMDIFDKDHNIIPGMLYDSNIYITPYEGTIGSFAAIPHSDKWDGNKIPVILTMNITTNEDVKHSPYEKIGMKGGMAQYRGGVAYGDPKEAYVGAMAMVWLSNSLVFNRFMGVCLYLALMQEKHAPMVMTTLDSFLLGASSCVPVNVAGMVVKNDTIIDAIEVWIHQFNKRDGLGNFKYSCTSPCGVTWCDHAYGYINMTSSEPRAWMEMPYCDFYYKIREIGRTKHMYKSMDTTYERLMVKPYYGRFHLGLYNKFNKSVWTNPHIYPQFNTFLKYYKQFNYFGFFRNKFTIESDLDELAGMPKYDEKEDWVHCYGLDKQYNEENVHLFPNPPKPPDFDDSPMYDSCFDDLFSICVNKYCNAKKTCKCWFDFLNWFVEFFEKEAKHAGWRFFILGVICSSIGWFIGLSAIGTPLANALYPWDKTRFYKKLCCDEDGGKDNINSSDIWQYAGTDVGYYIFAGILLHVGSSWVLSRHVVYQRISKPYWWLCTGAMWPFAVLFADVITVGIAGPEIVKNYLANLFITTVFRGLFLGIAQWPVLYFILQEPQDVGVIDYDPKGRIDQWFHKTVLGLWWILQSIFAWGIQLPAGVNFFFFALAIPPYKLPPLVVIVAIVAAVSVLAVTVLGGAYGNTKFCGKCD